MLKDILISMIIWVVVGCGNGSGVKRLDTRAVEKDTVLKWSQLVGESRLVRLETERRGFVKRLFSGMGRREVYYYLRKRRNVSVRRRWYLYP